MTTHFTLEIRLGNDAMHTGEDVAEALIVTGRKIMSNSIDYASMEDGENGHILDLNGNQVGGWRVRESRENGTLSEQVYDALMAAGRRGLADAFSDRPSADSIAQAVLDSHAIRDDWRRSGEQVRALITEAIQRDRGEI